MTNQFIQLALDLPLPSSSRQEDFFVTSSNQLTVDFINLWPNWVEHIAVIVGEKGAGKTHLAQIWQSKSGAVFCEAGSDNYLEILGNPDLRALILSKGSAVVGDAQLEEILFHLLNRAKAGELDLLILDETKPAHWDVALPDLRSRLNAQSVYEITPPDDLLLQALMIKQFRDRQISITPDVLAYLSKHIHRSYAAIGEIVQKIDTHALAKKRGVTIPLVREVLEAKI
jgi:chromosomal replication initiation ATPase DnaA